MENRAAEPRTSHYPAAKSLGWLWMILIALACFGLAAVSLLGVVQSRSGGGAAIVALVAALFVILGICSLVLSGWSATVRYELTPEKLSLFCGSVKYNVPLYQVKSVSKQDLRMTVWSSTRFPGFALGSIPYGGIGDVTMCSTRSLKGIIVIDAGKRKYGVTPADEGAFLAELNRYLGARA